MYPDAGCLQRNYRFFLAFVFTATTLCCLVFAFSFVRLGYIANHENVSWGTAIRHEPAAIVLIGYTFLAFWCDQDPNSILPHIAVTRVLL